MRSVCIEIEFKIEWMFDKVVYEKISRYLVKYRALKTLYFVIQHKLFFNLFKNFFN